MICDDPELLKAAEGYIDTIYLREDWQAGFSAGIQYMARRRQREQYGTCFMCKQRKGMWRDEAEEFVCSECHLAEMY